MLALHCAFVVNGYDASCWMIQFYTRCEMNCCPRAKLSPGLLADLANFERYVAETYSAHSFIELLQNADDAGAKRFLVMQDGDLYCRMIGKVFFALHGCKLAEVEPRLRLKDCRWTESK